VGSSDGRAAVSKTAGRRFDPCPTCHFNIMQKFLTKTKLFIIGTLEELRKCSWPKREELYESTIIVILAIVLIAVYVAGVDFVSQKVISFLTGF
jgi:preprotein translocase subunit SecE